MAASRAMPRSGPSLQIRRARSGDIPALVRAAETSIEDGEDVGFGTPRSDQIFTNASRLSAEWREPNFVRQEEVLVADVAGHVVGYVTIEDRGDVLELINIDVAGEHQRQGIGTSLVRFVEARARNEGKNAVTLGTSRNAAGVAWKSLPWWLSLGYTVTGEEQNAWTRAIGPGVREIRMRKNLH
jgi:predicted N-acetyltransferase YhbS